MSNNSNINLNSSNTNSNNNNQRDCNRPKGAMSAYACFVQVIREKYKNKHPDESVVFSEFSRKCAEKWRQLGPKEKKQFEDMAAVDKARFIKEMNEYVPPGGVKPNKRKQPRDPSQPKRGLSAFFLYSQEFRGQIKDEHPDWRVGDIAKELGKRWETCADKAKYEELARREKERFEREMDEYKNGTFVPYAKKEKNSHIVTSSSGTFQPNPHVLTSNIKQDHQQLMQSSESNNLND